LEPINTVPKTTNKKVDQETIKLARNAHTLLLLLSLHNVFGKLSQIAAVFFAQRFFVVVDKH
jgi:hypothetical protein